MARREEKSTCEKRGRKGRGDKAARKERALHSGLSCMQGVPSGFLKDLAIFRERGREGESEGENYQCERETLVASCMCPDPQPRHVPWVQTRNPDMGPSRESN